ncbi:MAG: hypothetical protein AAF587_12620 [Bacteroidota bacterium]
MKIHAKHLNNYPGTLPDLATELGDLRYDSLAEFLELLSAKLQQDALADAGRNRTKLAHRLQQASENMAAASRDIQEAWAICEPFMDTYES